MALVDEIPSGAFVALDTMALVYFMERHPRYLSSLRPVFQQIEAANVTAEMSIISLAEVLVGPLRYGNSALAQQHRDYLSTADNLSILGVSSSIARAAELRAADLRAGLGPEEAMRLPDALIRRYSPRVELQPLDYKRQAITKDGGNHRALSG